MTPSPPNDQRTDIPYPCRLAADSAQARLDPLQFIVAQEGRIRDLALFNLAIDSKLRGCDGLDLPVIR